VYPVQSLFCSVHTHTVDFDCTNGPIHRQICSVKYNTYRHVPTTSELHLLYTFGTQCCFCPKTASHIMAAIASLLLLLSITCPLIYHLLGTICKPTQIKPISILGKMSQNPKRDPEPLLLLHSPIQILNILPCQNVQLTMYGWDCPDCSACHASS